MIDFLVSWAEQLVIALVLILILEMILPADSKYRKYVKTIFGVFIIYMIVNPLINTGIEKYNFEGINNNTINISQTGNVINNEKIIEDEFKNEFKSNLEEFLKSKGYELVDIKEDIKYQNESIYINKIELQVKKKEPENRINVSKIDTKEKENNENNKNIETLKQEIAQYYDIEISNIEILESEK